VYLFEKARATLADRRPRVFGVQSDLVVTLRAVDVFVRTRMCRIMNKYGSDKGSGWHNYTTIYSKIFRELPKRHLTIIELGIGTNNPSLPSTMGIAGRPGASLRGWRECFPDADIFGADIDRSILFTEDRIQTYYCDQLDRRTIDDLWGQPGLRNGADIIVDDGLHTFEANASFLGASLPYLRDGGFYVTEDIHRSDLEKWRQHLPIYSIEFPDCDFALVELSNSLNQHDNNMMIARRRCSRT